MLKNKFLFLFCLIAHITFAQIQKADSIGHLLSKANEDTTKVNLLIELSNAYQSSNPDTMLFISQQAFQLARQLNYEKGKAWALNRIGAAFWIKADYPASMEYAFKSLHIFDEIKDKVGIATCYNSIANIYNLEHNYPSSMEFYEKSIKIFEELGNKFGIARAHSNIGRTYFVQKQYMPALRHLEQALALLKGLKEDNLHASALNTTGDVCQGLGNNKKALAYYFKALKISELTGIKRIITYSTRGISEVYQKQGKIAESIEYAEKTLQISKEIGYRENVKNAAFILADNYKILQQYNKALDYYVIGDAEKDSMFNAEKEKQIANLRTDYEIEGKEKEIKLLETEGRLQKEENKKQWIIVYSLAGGLILISLLVFLLYRNNMAKQKAFKLLTKQRNVLAEKNEEINQQREELLTQSEQLKELNSLKDRLLSIVAHDLRSPFNSLEIIVDMLDKQFFTQEELYTFKMTLTQNVKTLSEMLNNLLIWAKSQMGGVNTDKQLIHIQQLTQNNIDLFEIVVKQKQISVSNKLPTDFSALGDANQIDTVIRNLINNAIKFTRPNGEIVIIGEEDQKMVKISVQDTGVGIANENIAKIFNTHARFTTKGTDKESGTGLGLLICKDFVEKNGGEIWVESKVGIGSIFSFTLEKNHSL